MEQLTVAVLVGSVRAGRFGPTVAGWFARHADLREDVRVDLVDLAAHPLAWDMTETDGSRALAARLAAADGLVVVVPEYNHSYPAGLKLALDLLGDELAGKPVGFVSYGGLSGGLRAVEALRPVLSELHAVTVRETVSLAGPWGRFDDAGLLRDAAPVEQAADALLDQLLWWARPLRAARRDRPYGAAA